MGYTHSFMCIDRFIHTRYWHMRTMTCIEHAKREIRFSQYSSIIHLCLYFLTPTVHVHLQYKCTCTCGMLYRVYTIWLVLSMAKRDSCAFIHSHLHVHVYVLYMYMYSPYAPCHIGRALWLVLSFMCMHSFSFTLIHVPTVHMSLWLVLSIEKKFKDTCTFMCIHSFSPIRVCTHAVLV